MKIREIKTKPSITDKLKVAAYCRVSTEHDEQEGSLENQIGSYEMEIRSNPAYEFAGIYYDFAVSGYKGERPGFLKMMEDARKGKIDLILTKSISRFARNTQVVLKATRELKELGVAVFFELQNINTLTAEGELTMTIIAAFAQAESESISAVNKMSYIRRYEAGNPIQYPERIFGYRRGDNGEFVIVPEEAAIVREIYHMVADGHTTASVKRYLNDRNIRTRAGATWLDSTVIRLIENEVYKGDYVMHKRFVDDDRKERLNRGEVDSWYVEDDHAPIVSKRLWNKAQEALKRRRGYFAKGSDVMERNEENYPYMNKVFCAKCGHPLYPRVYSDGNRMNWGCSGTKRFGKSFCKGLNIPDLVLSQWDIEGNVYVYEKSQARGFTEFDCYKESYWKRWKKKKERGCVAPEINDENYPYRKKIFCGKCGSRLSRCFNAKTGRVYWLCSAYKHKGAAVCKGVRIFDDEIRKRMPIETALYISEERGPDGKKRYSYSGQTENG